MYLVWSTGLKWFKLLFHLPKYSNRHICLNGAEQDQTPQNAAFYEGITLSATRQAILDTSHW